MSIKKLMSTDLVKVDMDDTIKTVKEIFELVNFHHILVVKGEELVGVISDRDYFKTVGPRLGTPIETERDKMPLNKKVHQIMHRRLVTVKEDVSVYDVVMCFHKSKVTCVPVIDDDGSAIGIISWKDVVDALAIQMIKKQQVQ
jgi:acetoin utilization protein AcuB